MFDFVKKLLTPSNEGQIKKLRKTVEVINGLEPEIKKRETSQRSKGGRFP